MMRKATWGTVALAVVVLGLPAAACNKNDGAAHAAPAADHQHASQVTKITVNEKGFSPNSISVKKGDHLTLEFTRTSNDTCATQVSFPELNITKDLPLNTPVQVHVPTDQSRKLAFQCGMGMYKSSVVIN